MVLVLPQPELEEDRVPRVDDTITVTAIFGPVEFGERQEAVRLRGLGLRGDVAEQLSRAINCPVAVPVERQPGVIRARCGPRKTDLPAVAEKVEINAVRGVGEGEAVSCYVDDDWAASLAMSVVAGVLATVTLLCSPALRATGTDADARGAVGVGMASEIKGGRNAGGAHFFRRAASAGAEVTDAAATGVVVLVAGRATLRIRTGVYVAGTRPRVASRSSTTGGG